MSNRWNVTLILSLAYFVTGYLGLQFPVFGTNITLVWLPAGISVGFLMRFGYGCWPGVAIGALAVNLVNGLSIPLALGIASGNTFGPILATYLLRRTGFHATFEQHRDILLLCLSATVGMLVTASVGVTSLAWTDQIQAGFLQAWLTWWGRDAIGVIAATPLVLVITLERLRIIWRRGFEFSIWISLLVVAIIFVFILNGDWVSSLFALSILPFPLVVWGAMRFGAIGTSTSVILWAFGIDAMGNVSSVVNCSSLSPRNL